MESRYGYGRPRSPLYSPQRASLPTHVGHPTTHETSHAHAHAHAVPYRREERPKSHHNGAVITTTYKIKPDSTRSGSRSRTRSNTLDVRPVPTIVTTTPRVRPVIHSARPSSPLLMTPRSSQEDYYEYSIPAASKAHRRRASDDRGLARPAEADRGYSTKARSSGYPSALVRHADSLSANYGDDGYGYTNPRDLVAYDLMKSNGSSSSSRRSRRDSMEGGRSRPSSIQGLSDVQPIRAHDRERGPPPSTRGFDRIIPVWDAPSSRTQEEPARRSSRMEGLLEPEVPFRRASTRRPVSMYQDARDTSWDARRPVREEHSREYDLRDDDRERRAPRESRRKHERRDSYDDYRSERSDRPERGERERERDRDRDRERERSERERPERERAERERTERERPDRERSERERGDRVERDRSERTKGEKSDRDARPKERDTRDKVVAGLSLASAALGLGAVASNLRGDREEELSRKDQEEQSRRRKDEREAADLAAKEMAAKETKERRRDRDDEREERRYRDDVSPPREKDRESPDRTRRHSPSRSDTTDPRRSREEVVEPVREPIREPVRERRYNPDVDLGSPRQPRDENVDPKRERRSSPDVIDLGGRDPVEKQVSREALDIELPRARSETSAADNRSDASVSDEAINSRPRRPRNIESSVPAFNPNDTMDLMALKAALNNSKGPAVPPKEPILVSANKPIHRTSMTKNSRDLAELREELNRDRDPLEPSRQLRVVSPPREQAEEKPVKGILRQPREKFPEDPTPIREGVAPLKDAKKDGVPPDARWTKIARKLVNPEALDVGKERYEARDDFVIVLRVLSREEIQAYATATQIIRAEREEVESQARRRERRERHERHKRERAAYGGRRNSESDDSSDEGRGDKVQMLEGSAPPTGALMSGGLGDEREVAYANR